MVCSFWVSRGVRVGVLFVESMLVDSTPRREHTWDSTNNSMEVTDAAPSVFYTITFASGRPAKRRDEPGDAQLLQDFQRHVQRWRGPVWRVQLAGVKPGLRERPATRRHRGT